MSATAQQDAVGRIVGACHIYLVESGIMPCSDIPKKRFSHELTEAGIAYFAAMGLPADDQRLGQLLDRLAARPEDSIEIMTGFDL